MVDDQAKCSKCILSGGCIRHAPFTYPVRAARQSLPNERDLGGAAHFASTALAACARHKIFCGHFTSSVRCIRHRGDAVVGRRVLGGLWARWFWNLERSPLEKGRDSALPRNFRRRCSGAMCSRTRKHAATIQRTVMLEQCVYSTSLSLRFNHT